jgi:O-antigen ligase
VKQDFIEENSVTAKPGSGGWKDRASRAAGMCAVATGAAIPVSASLTAALVSIAVLLALLSGVYVRHWREMTLNPIALTAATLFVWLALTLLYTRAPMEEALWTLKKYRELLLIPLLLPLFLTAETRRWGTAAFLAAMLITLAGSYLDSLRQIVQLGSLQLDPVVFKSRITQSTFLAFTAYWAALRLWSASSRRWLWAALVALIAVDVFFLVGGRTGQVMFLALGILALYQRFRWKGGAIAVAGGVVLLVGASLTSSMFQSRIAETVTSLQDYGKDDFTTATTLRMSYLPNSLELITQHPLLGTGVGSFPKAYAEHVAGTPFPPTVNPHNEFILVGVQSGLPGALLLVLLFAQQYWFARRLPEQERDLAFGMVLTMVLGCMVNSFLLDSTEGHWYALFSAILFSRVRRRQGTAVPQEASHARSSDPPQTPR